MNILTVESNCAEKKAYEKTFFFEGFTVASKGHANESDVPHAELHWNYSRFNVA